MIDPRIILEHPEIVAENNRKRGVEIDLTVARGFLEERTRLIIELDRQRSFGNAVAGRMKTAQSAERDALVEEGRESKSKVKDLEAMLEDAEKRLREELIKFPNILRSDVPTGKDSADNLVVRLVGEPTRFDFVPKDHLELGEQLGLIDMARAAKISGGRFTYLLGDAVRLQFALIEYAISVLVPEGFTPVVPPHLISLKAMSGMGYLEHGGEEEIYHMKNDDLALIGTSEQAIGPMFSDETLPSERLPARFVGISPCYRREAGSYGKDVRGILRLHQFDKVEMFSFCMPERSDEEHEFLLSMEERLMQGLRLPYRVMKLCAGDTGRPSARTYDIETWMPAQNTYRETHSTSNTTEFQTRRLNIRYKDGDKKGFVHALNGTAFAVGRMLIAILENYQQADGSVVVPDVLRPWVGRDVIHSKTLK